MKRGPKPKPTKLRLVTGNAGKRPLPGHEPQAPVIPAEAPARLSEAARPYWHEFADVLRDAKITTTLDEAALVLLVEEYATWQQALNVMRYHGVLAKGMHGSPMVSPMFKIVRDSSDKLLRMLTDFGMTPSSRARVSTAKESRASDPWDEFTGGSGA